MRRLKFFSSIRTKFALTYFAVIAVVLILMNTYFLTASRDMIFASKQTFVQNQAEFIAKNLEDSFDALTVPDVERVMTRLDVSGVTYIIITDAAGNVLYDPGENVEAAGGAHTKGLIASSLEGYDIFYSKFYEGRFSSSAFRPVMGRGAVIGSVFVHEIDSAQGSILVEMQSTLKNISIIVVVFSVAMVAIIIWSVMRRITSILKAITSVREGEYSYRISMNGNDELALLGDEFNSLTGRLRETDEVRRRFVADASHELRTPLASIRLLSDSILQNEDMDIGTLREFIGDIGAEAERLSRTTEKLLTLTRLDSDISAEHEAVDIKKVINATLRMLEPLSSGRKLTLTAELQDNLTVMSTEDSIHQIVFNLVENAIKYNKPGGKVTVKLAGGPDGVTLTVDDTGVGIPEENLPYIFDRFYRVDKARSREAGGSGLGLSIVRNTVRELGGKISATPRPGGGMSFEVRL